MYTTEKDEQELKFVFGTCKKKGDKCGVKMTTLYINGKKFDRLYHGEDPHLRKKICHKLVMMWIEKDHILQSAMDFVMGDLTESACFHEDKIVLMCSPKRSEINQVLKGFGMELTGRQVLPWHAKHVYWNIGWIE